MTARVTWSVRLPSTLNSKFGTLASYVSSYSSLATIGLTRYEGGYNTSTLGTRSLGSPILFGSTTALRRPAARPVQECL